MGENPKRMSSAALAFIGDAVYEVYVRNYCIKKGKSSADRLHTAAVKYVRATSQAKAMRIISKELSEEDYEVMNRARNRKPKSVPKNADVMDYKWATAFEALVGYYYLSEKTQELEELMKNVILIIEGKKVSLGTSNE